MRFRRWRAGAGGLTGYTNPRNIIFTEKRRDHRYPPGFSSTWWLSGKPK
jgi:hypothetical protein